MAGSTGCGFPTSPIPGRHHGDLLRLEVEGALILIDAVIDGKKER
jgi:hypothetical protein